MILSILIPTVIGRERPLELLTNRIYSQIGDLKAESKVEVIVMKDNKEISIGESGTNCTLRHRGSTAFR